MMLWCSSQKVHYAGDDLIRIIVPAGLPSSLPESKQTLYKEFSSRKLSYSWIFVFPLKANLPLLLLIGLINLGTKNLHLHCILNWYWSTLQLLNISSLLTDWSILCSKTSHFMIKLLPLLLLGSGSSDNFILSKKKPPNWQEPKWWAAKIKKPGWFLWAKPREITMDQSDLWKFCLRGTIITSISYKLSWVYHFLLLFQNFSWWKFLPIFRTLNTSPCRRCKSQRNLFQCNPLSFPPMSSAALLHLSSTPDLLGNLFIFLIKESWEAANPPVYEWRGCIHHLSCVDLQPAWLPLLF